MSLEVLLVSTSSGSRGGGEFYVRDLALGLMQFGCKVSVLLSTQTQVNELAQSMKSLGIVVDRISYKNTYTRRLRSIGAFFDFPHQALIQKQLLKYSADIIHLNLQCIEDGLDLLHAVSKVKAPSIATVHVTKGQKELGGVLGTVRDLVSKRTYVNTRIPLVAVAEQSAITLKAFLASQSYDMFTSTDNKDKNDHIPIYSVDNGVPEPKFLTRDEARNKLGISSDSFLIGTLARCEDQKNPMFAPRLLSNLPSTFHYIWIGDGRMRGDVERSALSLKQSGRFKVTGWLNDASTYLKALDVFVLPSRYEGLPLALIEAMSAGLPIVCSDVDGCRNAIKQNETGVLCDCDDVDGFTAAINKLQKATEERQRLGNAALESYRVRFSLNAVTNRTINVYKDVIARFRER